MEARIYQLPMVRFASHLQYPAEARWETATEVATPGRSPGTCGRVTTATPTAELPEDLATIPRWSAARACESDSHSKQRYFCTGFTDLQGFYRERPPQLHNTWKFIAQQDQPQAPAKSGFTSCTTTLPFALPCSRYASPSFAWAKGNT